MAARSFLDEVGELPPDTQVALLRVLQEREFERVGGTQPIHVDVRVITATNRDLTAAVANGSFRQDLVYRLNVFPIEVPPLRERTDDILMLVEYFVRRYASRAGKHFKSIDKKTLALLENYDWPGNIRELQNVIERSVILNSGDIFAVDESWLSTPAARRPHVDPPVLARSESHERTRDHRSGACRIQGPCLWTIRSRGEAWRSAIHTRPSHQGAANQQDAIQVSLKAHQFPRIHHIHQIPRIHRSRDE